MLSLWDVTNQSFEDFKSMIKNMDLELFVEIFPDVGSEDNLFKLYSYKEMVDQYNKYICNNDDLK